MTTLSVEMQIAMLRPTVGFAEHIHKWLLVGAASGVIAAAILWHPVPLMIAAFLGIVGLSEQRAGPNIVLAISAYDADTPTKGEVFVAITSWDSNNRYHATVREQGHPDWEYEFVPHGWQPASHSYPAQIWRGRSEAQPILAVVEGGILIPRYDPKQVAKEGRSSHG